MNSKQKSADCHASHKLNFARGLYFILTLLMVLSSRFGFAQVPQKVIQLPPIISGVDEEFSGLAMHDRRIYLLPQYGQKKSVTIKSPFSLYSISSDSIQRVIDNLDSALSFYKVVPVLNLDLLPDSISKSYQGFESITFVGNDVFLTMETIDNFGYCFILKGNLDSISNTITINPTHFVALKKHPQIPNAGFESLTYIPELKKLIAVFEFNGINGGLGYMVDTALCSPPQKIHIPHLPFRITDVSADTNGDIYGLNYYWNGDFKHYGESELVDHHRTKLLQELPDLQRALNSDVEYLTEKTTSYARIVKIRLPDGRWEEVRRIDTNGDNWEGIIPFSKGVLVITDANRSYSQRTLFVYVEF